MTGNFMVVDQHVERYVFSTEPTALVPDVYQAGITEDDGWIHWPPKTVMFCQDVLFKMEERIDINRGRVHRFMCGVGSGDEIDENGSFVREHVEVKMISDMRETIVSQMSQATQDMKLTIFISYSPCATKKCYAKVIEFVNEINQSPPHKLELCIVFGEFYYAPRYFTHPNNTHEKNPAGESGLFELQKHEDIEIRVFTRVDWKILLELIYRYNAENPIAIHPPTENLIMAKRYTEDGKLAKDLWLLLARKYCTEILSQCPNEWMWNLVRNFQNHIKKGFSFERMEQVQKFLNYLQNYLDNSDSTQASQTAAVGSTATVGDLCHSFAAFLNSYAHQ